MSLIDTVTGWRWKIAAGVGAAALLLAGFFLFQAQMQNRDLVKQNQQLDARINDPTTGYVRRLAQQATTIATISDALETQNTRLRTQAAESGVRLTELSRRVAVIQNENLKLKADSAKILATKPQGDTLAERITDVDQRLLETLQ